MISFSYCLDAFGYLDTVSGQAMTTCSVPYRRGGAFAGVATLDLKLDGLASFLEENGGVTGGYAFALDQAGNLLFYPGLKASGGLPTLADLGREKPWLKPLIDAIAARSLDGSQSSWNRMDWSAARPM
ncbi:cache domain-containing protein [Pseudomonas saudiphocaensis]|uniref:cache domain-containing protein n=1 Tax=Pseudomonas saudiphocaensis TaxID=1499686 RepID=UPI001D1201F7|nr:cache domain-containing protein [Pseudomonas saudiphocaensis]